MEAAAILVALVVIVEVVVVAWIYFVRRGTDAAWSRFRQQHLKKIWHPLSRQSKDPNFQFDEPSGGKTRGAVLEFVTLFVSSMLTSLLVLLASPLFLPLLVYFFLQSRSHDHVWRSYRRRHLEKVRRPVKERQIDPNFRFDDPPSP
jgi:hypothetical protein